jgi:hypothetical protein
MPDVWTVQVSGQNYGPYPLEHMQAFIAEGRIVASSLVAYGADTQFHLAGDDLVLGPLIAPAAETASEPQVEPEPPVESAPRRYESPAQNFGRHEEEEDESAHMAVIFDLKSFSGSTIDEAIYSLGSAFPVMPQVWLLTTTQSVTAVRNLLVQKLGKLDALFVIDATHDKAAWFNFSPEPEARIRRIWGMDQRKAG